MSIKQKDINYKKIWSIIDVIMKKDIKEIIAEMQLCAVVGSQYCDLSEVLNVRRLLGA